MSLTELRQALKEKNLIIGTERTIKYLKNGKLKKVFLANNCKEDVRKDVEYYASVNKAEVIKLSKNNEELGIICKKPFSISALGC